MLLTPADLAGILPVVISGGRPGLAQRQTAALLPALHGITADPVWIVREDDAAGYQQDGHEVVTYSQEWAEDYARAHWTGLQPLQHGGFHGCCPGRETGCLTAERRGCWAVLMLDDNIRQISVYNGYPYARDIVSRRGGMALFADVLGAVTRSTNGRMTGAFLDAVNPNYSFKVCHAGFPYSLFVEQVGPGRESWYGPVEADIIHGYQYGTRAEPGTSVVVRPLHYQKDHSGGGGMRRGYDSQRAVALQRMFPETAKLLVKHSRANGRGEPRVFHFMVPGAIRNPVHITDHELFARVRGLLEDMAAEFAEGYRLYLHDKVHARAAKSRAALAGQPG